ncbi:MAG: hypothetical protein RL696_430 [Actinomycetota bacterium]
MVKGAFRSLIESETADEFCRAMALNVFQPLGVLATYLARLDSDNRISMLGSFGYSQQRVTNTGRPSIWEPMAITDTIRSGKVTIFESWDLYVDRYPDKAHLASPGEAFLCLPLRFRGSVAGGFGVTFDRALTGVNLDLGLWETLALAGEVFFANRWSQEMERNPIPLSDYGEDVKFAFGSLSTREKDVLAFVAQGMTNAQIARKLSYSESTIKQDTIHIFKLLGVSSRDEAAKAWDFLRRSQN